MHVTIRVIQSHDRKKLAQGQFQPQYIVRINSNTLLFAGM
jgi:hypothetical protein